MLIEIYWGDEIENRSTPRVSMPSLPDATPPARRQSTRQTNSIHANINRSPIRHHRSAPAVPPTPNHLDVLHQPTNQPPAYPDALSRAALFDARAQQTHINNLQLKINQMEQNFHATITSLDRKIVAENQNTKTQLDAILSILQNQRQSDTISINQSQPSMASTQASAKYPGSIPHSMMNLQSESSLKTKPTLSKH